MMEEITAITDIVLDARRKAEAISGPLNHKTDADVRRFREAAVAEWLEACACEIIDGIEMCG